MSTDGDFLHLTKDQEAETGLESPLDVRLIGRLFIDTVQQRAAMKSGEPTTLTKSQIDARSIVLGQAALAMHLFEDSGEMLTE
jgi:hypothetical protein